MFGGHIDVDHVRGGLTVGRRGGEGTMRMRAWPRIAILVQQLRCVYDTLSPHLNDNDAIHRRLLDAALLRALDSGSALELSDNPVIGAISTLLTTDGVMATAGSMVNS